MFTTLLSNLAVINPDDNKYEDADVKPDDNKYEDADVKPDDNKYEDADVKPDDNKYEDADVKPITSFGSALPFTWYRNAFFQNELTSRVKI